MTGPWFAVTKPMKLFSILFVFIFQFQAFGAPTCEQIFLRDLTSQSGLQTETQKIINHIRQHTDSGLAPFQTEINAYVATLDRIAKHDPVMAKLVKMLQTKQYTFAIDRSAKIRMDILKQNEFLNIHQAKRSSGAYDPKQRSQVEAEYIGLSLQEYDRLANSNKPKSMYLVPELSTGIELTPTIYAQDATTKEYNGDTWIFSLDKIEQNTSFVVGDSYNRALIERDFADDFKQMTIAPDSHFKKDNILDYALPLNLLQTAMPFYYEQIKTTNKFRFVDADSSEYKKPFEDLKNEMDGVLTDWQYNLLNNLQPNFNDDLLTKFPELKPFQNSFLFRPYGNYVEGLYYGPLAVARKVKTLIFRSNPPTAEEMMKFEELGIQVIDGRQLHTKK